VSVNRTNVYDVEPHVAEIYDQQEDYTDDVELIRRLIGHRQSLRILEPFCGTGRILIPLARDGHELVGLDQAKGMLDRARTKLQELPEQAQSRVTLLRCDVTDGEWPGEFDLVLLGGNCFYELASPEEQEGCIASAAAALRTGGYVYVDSDHMEGELDESWRRPGAGRSFPTGTCADGTRVESSTETIWVDARRRLDRFRRRTKVVSPDGRVTAAEYIQQKHPCSTGEVRGWLERHGFVVQHLFGDRAGNPYSETSGRAILWACKKGH